MRRLGRKTYQQPLKGPKTNLGFGDLFGSAGDHIGHFYRSQDDAARVLVPYFAAGLRAGDKCTLFCRPEIGEMVLAGLGTLQVPVDEALASGQFVLHEGARRAEATAEIFSNLIVETRSAGYRLIRNAGDMAWGLRKVPSSDELVKWEAMYDLHVAPQFPLIALCQYDLRVFGGDVMLDALKTHPLCIIGEMIHKNPFSLSPQELLAELEGRNPVGNPE